ncbi:ChbG/HpnK family deacetylase [Clostridium cadaveris]|uniref:ChbG/HpnK family deacetylase n=1 Tax=Clostridium cadaveris TaxID=1529 RepID=UPI003996C7D1
MVGEDGKFINPNNLPQGYTYCEEDLEKEIRVQYDKFLELMGRKLLHLDSHLFSTDKVPEMRKLSVKLALEKDNPFRNYDIDVYPLRFYLLFLA